MCPSGGLPTLETLTSDFRFKRTCSTSCWKFLCVGTKVKSKSVRYCMQRGSYKWSLRSLMYSTSNEQQPSRRREPSRAEPKKRRAEPKASRAAKLRSRPELASPASRAECGPSRAIGKLVETLLMYAVRHISGPENSPSKQSDFRDSWLCQVG